MELVATELVLVPPGDPVTRPAEVVWDDVDLIGGRMLFYRLTAVDSVMNESTPSQPVSLRVVDTAVPPAPTWIEATWVLVRVDDRAEEPWPDDGIIPLGRRAAIRLAWTSTAVEPTFTLTRSPSNQWSPRQIPIEPRSIGPTKYLFHDTDAEPGEGWYYQIEVMSAAGVPSRKPEIVRVSQPSSETANA
jgi:hypothetical protein